MNTTNANSSSEDLAVASQQERCVSAGHPCAERCQYAHDIGMPEHYCSNGCMYDRPEAMPTLPQSLLTLIGKYGMARTDGASEIERIHRWQLLIDGIKEYARAAIAKATQP